jgi:tRNA(adenine34) deaminase
MKRDDQRWMREALLEARRCLRGGDAAGDDVPVGAVVVLQNQIIGRGHNQVVLHGDPTLHAEVVAIRDALRTRETPRLEGATLYVSLEPCPMCAGALWLARLERLVFGAFDAKAGACGSVFDIARDVRLNHQLQVRGGVMESECAALLRDFFAARRDR